MSNSTTDHKMSADNPPQESQNLTGVKVADKLAPMTLPDDIELDNKILDLLEPHYENIGFTREHAKTSVTFRKFQELIAQEKAKWNTDARLDELNNFPTTLYTPEHEYKLERLAKLLDKENV